MVSKRRRSRRRGKKGSSNSGSMSPVKKVILYTILASFLMGSAYLIFLDFQIRTQFEGKRWSVPAYVYARPLELYPNKKISKTDILYELNRLNYQLSETPNKPGYYSYGDNHVAIYTRRFKHWDAEEQPKHIRINLSGGIVVDMLDVKQNEDVPIVRLDPVVISKIYPSHNEDRILVKLNEDVPKKLVEILKAVEDRNFDSHIGISFKGIFRAIWINIKKGGARQGGSTLTQQLVKNYFLTREKTIWRKLNEMAMAVLLEFHYSKNEILEAYLNEVALGQDGKRAIHGFGLASHYFFGKPLRDLEDHQLALLVGMVKAPSAYNPRRRRGNALRRRNVVLDVMREQKIISEDVAITAKDRSLDVVSKKKTSITRYPAFVDLLRRQLRKSYRPEDITTGGLRIFTTLDPLIQYYAEESLKTQIASLSKWKHIKPGKLQGAVVITSRSQGDVLAIVGDADPRYPGYNRALDAKRQIGSLVKPAVYLAALKSGKTLASLLDDSEFSHESDNGKIWAPLNYDKEFHGDIPLYYSLAHSYNVSTARLGLEVGLDKVIDMIQKVLGKEKEIPEYPSLLLGAIQLTPIEVAQMYQTFAGGGFNTKLRSIQSIMNSKGDLLTRNSLKLKSVVDAGLVFQLNSALQVAVASGTGRGLWKYNFLHKDKGVAGKTGTTDDTKDSWFSAFTGNYLGVVWVGRDDSKPTGLTGSVGALRVWGNIFKHINAEDLKLEPPSDADKKYEYHWIDPKSGLVTTKHCSGAVQLPFVEGRSPREQSSCTGGKMRWLDFIKR